MRDLDKLIKSDSKDIYNGFSNFYTKKMLGKIQPSAG